MVEQPAAHSPSADPVSAPGGAAALPPPAADGASEQELSFPQLARLELDELLLQLVDRAQEVLATQGRLRGLLAATRMISSDLSLPVLLRKIVEAACQLVGAQYGALGVIGPDRRLSDFITVGIGEGDRKALGPLPEGEGILGQLIRQPRPLRLDDLTLSPESVGFPPGHPHMRSFLGVPIRLRDRVFGNLYLTEKLGGAPFTADDEELLGALAAAAAAAIGNAELLTRAQRRQEWLHASTEITRQLVTGVARPLDRIAAGARRLAVADLAAILLPDPDEDEQLRVRAADGLGAEAVLDQVVPPHSLAGQAITGRRDLHVDDVAAVGASFLTAAVKAGPAVVVRFDTGDGHPGVLALSRRPGSAGFHDDERHMAATFAGHAAVALELAAAQHAAAELAQLQDRDRLAADMHDHVIRRLFGAGLFLHTVAGRLPDPTAGELREVVDELDSTIRTIRQTIYEWNSPG